MTISLITGANSGIGFAAAEELARNDHEIIMLCRDGHRGKVAKEKLQQKTGRSHFSLFIADLADLDQIQAASEQITENFSSIDRLLNNAGIILSNREITHVGLEKTLAVNHLGHFLLTDLLLPQLQQADAARVINTSSGAHYGGSFNFDDLNYEHGYNNLGFQAYSRSKLANILFTHKLDRLFDDTAMTAYAIHPGFVGSNFAKNNGLLAKIAMTLMKPFAKSTESGAQPLIYLASTQGIEQHSGEYFVDTSGWFSGPKITPKRSSERSYDQNLEDRLWQVSREYIRKWNPEYELNYEHL